MAAKAVSVEGSIMLTASEPAALAGSPSAAEAMADAIADMAAVPADSVTAVAVPARRLQGGSQPHGLVRFSYAIRTPEIAEAKQVAHTMEHLELDRVEEVIASKLSDAGLSHAVQVLSVTAAVAQPTVNTANSSPQENFDPLDNLSSAQGQRLLLSGAALMLLAVAATVVLQAYTPGHCACPLREVPEGCPECVALPCGRASPAYPHAHQTQAKQWAISALFWFSSCEY